jgi:hypothetical protein
VSLKSLISEITENLPVCLSIIVTGGSTAMAPFLVLISNASAAFATRIATARTANP